MKKLLPLLLACLFVFLIFLPVHAEEEQVLSSKQISEEELAILYNTELYNENLKGTMLTDQPIIKIYRRIPYELASSPFYEMLRQLEEQDFVRREYLIGGKHIFVHTKDGITNVGIRGYERETYVPPYLFDIPRMDTTVTLRGTECNVLDIYCFDESENFGDSVIYLITDKGIFVMCYAYPYYAEPAVFTEEEFSEFAASFVRYEEAIYEPGAVGGRSLLNYVLNTYGTRWDRGVEKDNRPLILIAAASAVISTAIPIAIAGIILFVITRRAKRKKAKLSFLLSALLIALCAVFPTHAAEEQTAFSTQVSAEERAILYDTSLYDEDLTELLASLGTSLQGKPIVKIYTDLPDYYQLARYPIQNLLPMAEHLSSYYPSTALTNEQTSSEYYSLNELMEKHPNTEQKRIRYPEYLIDGIRMQIRVDPTKDYTPTVRHAFERDYPPASAFITDMQNLSAVTTLKGVECTVLDVYCFEDTQISPNTYAYLITDQGVFVKCYSRSAAEPLVFTEAEFSAYALSYYYHCGSTENDPSFADYVQNIYGTPNDLGVEEKDYTYLIYIGVGVGIGIAAAVLVAGGASTFFIVKKLRRKKRSAQSEN